jgi:hypothetical protein
MKKPGRRVWRIRKGAALQPEIFLVKDLRSGREGHYMLAPAKNMPLKKYLGAPEALGLDRSVVELVLAAGLRRVG